MIFSRPMPLTSQAVSVVPTLAPMTTPMAWLSCIRPALTKPTTITVVALLLCTRQVTAAPASTATSTLCVMMRRMRRIRSPATRRRASLITRIPNRNRPSPPTTRKTMSSVPSGSISTLRVGNR